MFYGCLYFSFTLWVSLFFFFIFLVQINLKLSLELPFQAEKTKITRQNDQKIEAVLGCFSKFWLNF